MSIVSRFSGFLVIALTAAACGSAPTSPTPVAAAASSSSAAAVLTPEGWDLQSSFTVSGDLSAGNTVTLDLTVANVGTTDYPGPGFGFQFLMPAGINRTNPLPLGAICEGYRGHQGGANIIRDFCYSGSALSAGMGPIPAGTSHTVSLPVKLANAGDFVVYGSTHSIFFEFPLTLHVVDPVKTGGGGTTTTSYKISISKNGKGSVTADPAAAAYAAGTVVTLTARPDPGSPWMGWGGACSGTATTCTLTMNANLSVTANFR